MRLVCLGLLVALSFSAVACSSSDKEESTTQIEDEGLASVEVSAADGGEVKLGKASLEIPGGALGEDTTITVESKAPSSSMPDAASLKGLVYDFGPDGTSFAAPAALTLPSVGEVGVDQEAVIAWLDEAAGTWQDLATTTASDGSLQAEITHFTKFVVRLRGVVTSDCAFSKCGGDITGTWKLTGLCADVPESTGPLGDSCPSATADVNVDVQGTISFADGMMTKNLTSSVTITYTVPNSCIATLHGSVPASCDELSKVDEEDGATTVCSGDPSESCTCVRTEAPETDTDPGTYEISGGDIAFTEQDGEPEAQSFCVKGDELRVHRVSDDGIELTYIATKQ